MSTILLFGAGASYGSVDCKPCPPPLGKDLFNELCLRGGIAASVDHAMAEKFRGNFESGMMEFFEAREADTAQFLQEMALYFVTFEPGPLNLYHSVVAAAKKTHRTTVLATTNYDLLVEWAVTEVGMTYSMGLPPSDHGDMIVYKLHGSCNYLPDVHVKLKNVAIVGFTEAAVDGPVRVAHTRQEVEAFCRAENSMAPAIALYAPGKRVLYCPAPVALQQRQFRQVVAKAARIFVIGLRPNPDDEHIWRPLAKAPGRIAYAGCREDFERLREDIRRRDTLLLGETFDEALPQLEHQLRRLW